jgi:hypothetical protein
MEGDGWEVREPRVTPWGGDIRQRLKDEADAACTDEGGGAEETLLVAPMERALAMFESFKKKFLLCPRHVSLMEDEVGEDVKLMFNYWREWFAEGGGNGGIAAKFVCRTIPQLPTDPFPVSINLWSSPSPPSRQGRASSITGRGLRIRRRMRLSSHFSFRKSSLPRQS